ncbi:putative serine/threonine-protein kinase PBL7 [Cucurbita argyrosperma subsp. argyrosperma]|nr:putative serine/threonine-protein kinase PBL7 [Cucurbita argyrosperma subsp. argyrosperma]
MLHTDSKHRERAFRMEVDLLSRLHSPCLVELLGYCADQHHRLLIFEFMHNGTLHHHLHNPNTESKPLDWNTRLRIALDCAKALEFLHEHAVPSVIHRNFKCTNVLLDQDFRAKVSDFSSAKMGSDKINGQISTQVLGTTGYLAPEYASTGKLTTKSDVYSYGVVLLELLTGRVPVDIKRPQGEHVLVSWALPRLTNREKVEKMIDPAIQGKYSKKDLIQVAAIAAMCVQPEADYRPLMTDVVQSLVPLVKNPSSSSRFFK